MSIPGWNMLSTQMPHGNTWQCTWVPHGFLMGATWLSHGCHMAISWQTMWLTLTFVPLFFDQSTRPWLCHWNNIIKFSFFIIIMYIDMLSGQTPCCAQLLAPVTQLTPVSNSAYKLSSHSDQTQ